MNSQFQKKNEDLLFPYFNIQSNIHKEKPK
jgi:hypothetical protein